MEVKREQIIEVVDKGLKDDPSVFALWLEGSDANNTLDQYSDIDIWLDVEDGKEQTVFTKIEDIFSNLGELNFAYDMRHPSPQIHQKVFHLKNTPETLLIDVCIQSHSRNFEFTRGIDDEPKVIFDKGAIKFKELNQEEFQKELKSRVERLKITLAQKIRVLTKVKRGDFLESLMYYQKWIVAPLVELLRIKYIPHKRDYHLKHISRDLPKEVVEQIEAISKIQSVKDIENGIKVADELFKKTL